MVAVLDRLGSILFIVGALVFFWPCGRMPSPWRRGIGSISHRKRVANSFEALFGSNPAQLSGASRWEAALRAREEQARNLRRGLNANLLGVGITSVSVRDKCSRLSTNN